MLIHPGRKSWDVHSARPQSIELHPLSSVASAPVVRFNGPSHGASLQHDPLVGPLVHEEISSWLTDVTNEWLDL